MPVLEKIMLSVKELSPEFRLAALASCLPSLASVDRRKELIEKSSAQVADWGKFVSLVDRHRIPGLAYTNLSGLREIVPTDIMDALKRRSQDAKLNALRHAAEFSRLTRLLAQHGIPCMQLKGQMLSQQLYGDPALRQTKDIDLLVKPQDLAETERLLAVEGYRLSADLSPAQAHFILTTIHHHEYHHPQRKIILELHWRCYMWNDEHMELLWDSSRGDKFCGVEIMTMETDLQLLYLSDHGSIHKWFRLKWLGDVATIIADNRVTSWEHVVELARRLDFWRGLGQCSRLVEELYNIPLPDPLSLLAREKTSVTFAHVALEVMKKSEEEVDNLSRKGEGVKLKFYMKRLRPSLPVASLLRLTLVSKLDFELLRLPDRLFWMYVPLRPFLWFWRRYLSRWLKK